MPAGAELRCHGEWEWNDQLHTQEDLVPLFGVPLFGTMQRAAVDAAGVANIEGDSMNYDEAMEATVSRGEAMEEIRLHPTGAGFQIDWHSFLDEVGDASDYLGAEVLRWLGY